MIVATLLALGGAYLLYQRSFEPMLGVFLFVAAGSWLTQSVWTPELALPRGSARPRFARWPVLVPLSIATALMGTLSFLEPRPYYSWGYLACMVVIPVVALIADPPLRRWRVRFDWRPHLGRETLAALGIILASLAIRVVWWRTVPPGVGEDQSGIIIFARQIVEGGRAVSPVAVTWWRMPEMQSYLAVPFIAVGIDPLLSLMLLGAIPGTVVVWLTYVLAREAYGPRVALVAAALLALNRAVVMFSRMGFDYMLAPALGLAAIWFTWRGLRSGRLVWFALAGVACGVELIYLWIGSIAPLWVLLVWLIHGRRTGLGWRGGFAGVSIAGVVAAGIFTPRALYSYLNPDHMSQTTSYFIGPLLPKLGLSGVLNHASSVFLGFVHKSGGVPEVSFGDKNEPLYDVFSSVLLMLGVGYLIFPMRGRWTAFWLGAAVIGLAVAVSSTGEGSNTWRLSMAMPPFAVGAALILVTAVGHLERLGSALRPIAWVAAAVVIGATGFRTHQDYFIEFAARPSVWPTMRPDAVAVGLWLRDQSDRLPSTLILTTRELTAAGPFSMEAPRGLAKTIPYQPISGLGSMPLAVPLAQGVERVWLFTSTEPWGTNPALRDSRGVKDLAEMYYPPRSSTLVRWWDGRPLYHLIEWDRAAIEATQGLARDPEARCLGGNGRSGGWRGLIYVEARGRYRLGSSATGYCANLDLRRQDAFEHETYLARGWHELTLVGPGSDVPPLFLIRREGAMPVPRHYLHAGPQRGLGLLATFAEGPDTPPVERQFLGMLDADWGQNPPLEGTSFFLRAQGWLEVDRPAPYELRFSVAGPLTVSIAGARILDDRGREPRQTKGSIELTAGRHPIEITYHALSLAGTSARISWPGGEQFLDVLNLSPP